jgi:hypothetical protein
MISSTLDDLNQGIEKYYLKNFSGKMKKLHTLLLVESETETCNFDFTKYSLPELSLDEKISLGVISWFTPEEIRWTLQFWIIDNWGGEFKEVKDIILTSKNIALGYLIIQNRFSSSDFFGNILRKLSKKINSNSFNFQRVKTGKVDKYTGYCRGYGETGTWSPHQPEKGLRKTLLSLDEIAEKERYQKYVYTQLLDTILLELKRKNQ